MKKIIICIMLIAAGYAFAKMDDEVKQPVSDIKNKIMRLANVESSESPDTVSVGVGKAGQLVIDGNKIAILVIEIVRRNDGQGAIFMVGEIKARKKVGGMIPLHVGGSKYQLNLVSVSGNSAKFRVSKGERNES
jgi:hypothetical protein